MNFNWNIKTEPVKHQNWKNSLARCTVSLPSWCKEKNTVTIEILHTQLNTYYYSTMWIFNRGITILDEEDCVNNIELAIQITEKRLKEMFEWTK